MNRIIVTAALAILGLSALGATAQDPEITSGPVAFVVDYSEMEAVDLRPEDVVVFSTQIPRVERRAAPITNSTTATVAEMEQANVPIPEKKEKPNTGKKKRLEHAPIAVGSVTGDVTILAPDDTERVVLVTGIQGEGMMTILVKGGTGWTAEDLSKPIILGDAPMVPVGGEPMLPGDGLPVVTESAAPALSAEAEAAVKEHLGLPGKSAAALNVRVAGKAIKVKAPTEKEKSGNKLNYQFYCKRDTPLHRALPSGTIGGPESAPGTLIIPATPE